MTCFQMTAIQHIRIYCFREKNMEHFVKRLDKAYDAIDYADYILVGAGAGFSAAAGIEYSGKRFEDNFKDFIEKYGLTDMYSSGFYPFKTSEEKWAYWSRHVYMNRYSVGKTELYRQLLDLIKNKDYFILTTNVEHQFWINGFEDDRIFATQGDYGLFQCSEPCHEKLYSNRDFVFKAIENKTIGNDLDLTNFEHEKTLSTVINSFTNDYYNYIIDSI